MKRLIYAVEDDKAIQEVYKYSTENDFECVCFSDSKSFFDTLDGINSDELLPDLILLDVMLPGENGFEILPQLKSNEKTALIPVIMVSAKGEEISKVRGLNMGADDYIAKPFGVMELVARIKANLRKTKNPNITDIEKLVFKDITIDSSKHLVLVNNTVVQVTLKEYNILYLLCKNAEKVQTRETIFNEVWGDIFLGESRTLDIHIKEIRKKLNHAKSEAVIQTIRSVGYMIV